MDGQKVPNVIPSLSVEAIVVSDQRGRRLANAVDQRIRERADLNANDLERRGLQRFDKSNRIAHAHHIAHPVADVSTGTEFHHARLRCNGRIFPAELLKGVLVGNEI